MTTKLNSPTVSIVIAVADEHGEMADCLQALRGQLNDQDECIVVSSTPTANETIRGHEWVRLLETRSPQLIPELWALGMSRARGEVVAITTSHFVPAQNWVATMRDAHSRLWSTGIGGTIEPPHGKNMTSWATYFQRYNRFVGYRSERQVEDIAGDNATYKRRSISPMDLQHGFWEQEFHNQILAKGETITFVPQLRVRQNSCFGFWAFVRQRFQHGRKFGQARARNWGLLTRCFATFASPLIPVVFLLKIAVNVAKSRRDVLPFLASLPVLCCFLIAWSSGEAYGYAVPGTISGSTPIGLIPTDGNGKTCKP